MSGIGIEGMFICVVAEVAFGMMVFAPGMQPANATRLDDEDELMRSS